MIYFTHPGRYAYSDWHIPALPLTGVAEKYIRIYGPDGLLYEIGWNNDANPKPGQCLGLLNDPAELASAFVALLVGEIHGRAVTYPSWQWPWDAVDLGPDPTAPTEHRMRVTYRYPTGGGLMPAYNMVTNASGFAMGKAPSGPMTFRGKDPQHYAPGILGFQLILNWMSGNLYEYPLDVLYETPL